MKKFSHYGFILIISLLSACAAGPDFQAPATPANTQPYTIDPLKMQTTATSSAGGQAQSFEMGQVLPVQWWTLFKSPSLNALVHRGIIHNPSLAAASAAIQQAQENLNAEVGAGLFPSISAQLAAHRERVTGESTGDFGSPTSVFNLYNTSVNLSYNLDIFGSTRRTLEALSAQVNYQKYQWQAAYLSLTGNIVTTAITEASLRAQIAETQALIRSQENQLNITQKQQHLGGASQSDVFSQQTQLAQLRATLPPLQKSLAQYQSALMALIGALPGEAQLPQFALNDLNLPTHLPVSLPSQLVRQRPDIKASEALLHQASANIGVAKTARFPQLVINGSYGYSHAQGGGFFSPQNAIWNFGTQLTQSVFDAGALKAQQAAAVDAYNQAAAQYKQTVLLAFQNVADALHAITLDADALKAQSAAASAAGAQFALVQKQYRLGAVSYLAQLDAERQYQQTRINRIQAQAARYADTVALFQALGGGVE